MEKSISGYKLIFCYIGVFVILMGIILLIPLVVLPFFSSELIYAKNFIIPAILCILLGIIMHYPLKKYKIGKLKKEQDMVLVILIWAVCILIGTLPFLLLKKYTFIECLFEMTSGYTTTGFSICDVANTPHIYLFYRSITQFVGGVGFVLILTCIMSDSYGLKIYTTEGHSDRLLPNLAKSARLIFGIYCGYIAIGTIAYKICGMTVFDAINHSMAAVSTGGFSTKTDSIGYYSNWNTGFAIELITIVLMLLGSTNFLVNLFLITGKFKKAYKHCEIKFLLFFSLPAIIFMLITSYISGIGGVEGFRLTLFQFTTAFTTTGFQTISDFRLLGECTVFFMIILMIMGGELGSAAGGIKQYRIIIALKGIYYNIRDSVTNSRVIRTNYISQTGNIRKLSDKEISSNNSFIIMWILILICGSLLISIPAQSYGYNFGYSLFEFASALSGTGLSIGIVALKNQFILFIMTVAMFIGRLEITIVFLGVARFIKDLFSK